ALAAPTTRAIKPVAFFLAGDSTTAKQSSNGGGWGDGFRNKTLKSPAFGTNYGHNGATTVSFREGGDWDKVLADVKEHKDSNNVFVTIQFGHNDQKASKGISVAQYTENLEKFAKEVTAAGGTPILVTPITRRSFKGDEVKTDLAEQAAATIKAAEATEARYIDLNAASIKYVNAIGAVEAAKYNLKSTDNTHLNEHGSVVFGRLVSDLLEEKYDDIAEWTTKDEELSQLIKDGKPA
ncbi:carbohydrate esterase family 12 protein, partial [Aplosporella prunicola CBS 121167]